MRYVYLILLLSLPNTSYADQKYETSKLKVFQITCERTFFHILLQYSNSKPPSDLSQAVSKRCSDLAKDADNRKVWAKVEAPAGNGCMAAIRACRDANPKLPDQTKLFMNLCFDLSTI